jgi:hypothetical protein
MTIPVAEDRVLRWPGCGNVRDLGGLPTTWGGWTRPGVLVRGDRPREASVAAMLGHGVRLVLDLRSRAERAADPGPRTPGTTEHGPRTPETTEHGPRTPETTEHGPRTPETTEHGPRTPGTTEVVWRHLPVLREEDAVLEEMGETLAGIYRRILDHGSRRLAAVISAIAHAPSGAVLVHCHSGKDRTGLAIALALTLAGVAPEDVAADYAMTAACLDLGPHLASLNGEAERARSRRLFAEVGADTMLATLTYLDDRYGGGTAYLLEGGLPPADVASLRARLTTGPAQPPG